MEETFDACDSTIEKEIADLNNHYELLKKEKSVKKNVELLENILKNNEISEEKIRDIIKDYILNMVPTTVINKVKNNYFSSKIAELLDGSGLTENEEEPFTIGYNSFPPEGFINPKIDVPDWYIHNGRTIIYGYNLINLTAKNNYIWDDLKHNDENVYILTVIPNRKKTKSSKIESSIKKTLDYGFNTKRLTTYGSLPAFIAMVFNLDVPE